jgi:methanogenic corrinoid protein MtbC1
MAINAKIADAMTELEEDDLYKEVKAAVSGGVPASDILDSLQAGMAKVGERFSENTYFLSELMMSAELFSECQKLIGNDSEAEPKYGTAVIGTVSGDVHDIGKNIVVSLFRSNGFKVVDVGVDAPAKAFVDAIRENDPVIVGLSCLLTTAFDSMKETVAAIRAEGLDKGRLIMIGGGPVEKGTLDYVKADKWAKSAQSGVLEAISFVENR